MALQDLHVPNSIETILDSRTVTPAQVLDLRRTVWPDGQICRREAELLFEINDTLENVCGEWRDFFAEGMVAHLIEQASPRGYIGAEDAIWFRERILSDGRIKGETELETLVQLLEKAVYAPERLTVLALEAVHDAVLEGDHDILGHAALVPGELGDPEVALLRRVLYAKAAGRSEAISKNEAELIFDLNDATVGADNAASWSALFVNTISNYLLVHSGYEPPSRERLKQVDRWLNQPTDGLAAFGRRMAQGLADMGNTMNALDIFGTDTPMEEVYRDRLDAEEERKQKAQRIDASEARWLIERINRDGALSVNEAALLHFLQASGLDLDAAMAPMMARI